MSGSNGENEQIVNDQQIEVKVQELADEDKKEKEQFEQQKKQPEPKSVNFDLPPPTSEQAEGEKQPRIHKPPQSIIENNTKFKLSTTSMQQPLNEYISSQTVEKNYISLQKAYMKISQLKSPSKLELQTIFQNSFFLLVLTGMTQIRCSKNKDEFMVFYFTNLSKHNTQNSSKPLYLDHRFINDLEYGYLQISLVVFKPALQNVIKTAQIGGLYLIKSPLFIGNFSKRPGLEKFSANSSKLILKQFDPNNIIKIGLVQKFSHCEYVEKVVGAMKSFDKMMINVKEQHCRKCKNFVNSEVQKICDFHKQVQKRELMISTDRVGVLGFNVFDPRNTAKSFSNSRNQSRNNEGLFGENAADLCRQNYKRFKTSGKFGRKTEEKKDQIKLTKNQQLNKQKMAKLLNRRNKKLTIDDDVNTKIKKKDDLDHHQKLQKEQKAKVNEYLKKVEAQNISSNDTFLEISSKNATSSSNIDFQRILAKKLK